VAIDAHNPNFVVAGAIDHGDQQPCPRTLAIEEATCEIDNGVGVSGVYFSFDRGQHWTQPAYTGLTARDCGSESPCDPHVGPIGRVPWYYENGLVDAGDPAVAIGPRPVNGRFSWANGARVYYSNNAADLSDFSGSGAGAFRGYQAVAVSRLDNPTPARVARQSSWMPPVVVDQRQATTTFDDKDQIWADNAASSPFFGRVYECNDDFRSNGGGHGFPEAPMVSVSADGGDTWTTRQVTSADANGNGQNLWGRVGCTIRTDSNGVAYLFDNRVENPTLSPAPQGEIVMQKSYDGGKKWTSPSVVQRTTYSPYVDPLSGRFVIDGYTGARTDDSGDPSLDVANGAPTGTDATNRIVLAWSDTGVNSSRQGAMVTSSTDRGNTWNTPTRVSASGDRPLFTAAAISPSGDRAYVVYEAVTSPWRGSDVTSPRHYHGVFRSAPVGLSGLGSWTTVYNGPSGDLRATFPGHRLREERVGDYIYAAASRNYGVGVWIDARNAAVCPAIQDWRGNSLAAGAPVIPAPWPLADCPPTFGNTDVRAVSTG
jgi:hypothetical protein